MRIVVDANFWLAGLLLPASIPGHLVRAASTAEALRALPYLRTASTCGIGTDAFDLAVAREQGITICDIPGKTAPIVA